MVPERIAKAALSHSVWLVLHRKDQLGPGVDRSLRHCIRVFYMKADPDRCATERFGAQVARSRRLVDNAKLRVANREHGNHGSIRTRQS
jgi:hypothetical protein